MLLCHSGDIYPTFEQVARGFSAAKMNLLILVGVRVEVKGTRRSSTC